MLGRLPAQDGFDEAARSAVAVLAVGRRRGSPCSAAAGGSACPPGRLPSQRGCGRRTCAVHHERNPNGTTATGLTPYGGTQTRRSSPRATTIPAHPHPHPRARGRGDASPREPGARKARSPSISRAKPQPSKQSRASPRPSRAVTATAERLSQRGAGSVASAPCSSSVSTKGSALSRASAWCSARSPESARPRPPRPPAPSSRAVTTARQGGKGAWQNPIFLYSPVVSGSIERQAVVGWTVCGGLVPVLA